MKRRIRQAISLILSLSMVLSLLTGCGRNELPSDTDVFVTDKGVIYENENGKIELDKEEIIENVSNDILYAISTSWEDYVGDVETFVYGLITNELGYKYDVFPASVTLSNGISVFGLAYTDYQECYTNEDESIAYFPVGFIPGIGELEIPEEDFNAGILVENLDYTDENAQFILAYQSEAFSEHCVVYNKYVTYGVNSDGILFYETEEYERGKCDESIGSLYSFDESRYVYDVNVGEYMYISGEPLATQLDYLALEEEINKILEMQDTNFASVDIQTSVYFAQETVTNYLLSLQEETFLGYDVKSLVAAAEALDPMECYRITSEGLLTIDVYSTEDEIARWLVGTASVIAVAIGTVGSMVFIECPPLSALSSSLVGTGIEVFMQVVVSEQKVSDIDWAKVVIAASAGAVSGYLGPYIMATTGVASGFVIDSVLDGVIGGVEQTIYAWMDGADGKEMIDSFGYGFALGFGLSASFKGVGTMLGKVASKVSPLIVVAGEKVFPKLTAKASKFVTNMGNNLNEFKRALESSPFHSKYVANKLAFKRVAQIAQNGASELKTKSFDNLKNEGIMDVNDTPISKKELEKIFSSAKDGDIIGKFKMGDDVINIKKQNGMVGIVFDESKYLTVEVQGGLQNNGDSSKKEYFRLQNFDKAATELQLIWSKNPDTIPVEIKSALDAKGINIKFASSDNLVEIITDSRNGWVMHENIDMRTITLVPRALHKDISHMGGFALAGYVKTHMGQIFFDRFVSAAATGAVIAQ